MMGLDALKQELDAWCREGRVPAVWWRDDDLGAPTVKLDPLLSAADALDFVPMLAVVPAWASADLPRRLSGVAARIAVHGFAHVDHQAGRGKKSEFGDARPLAERRRDAANGKKRLEDLFGTGPVACFVPPWNRAARDFVDILPALGFLGLSAFTSSTPARPVLGMIRADTHVDVITWKNGRDFIGIEAMAREIAARLREQRRSAGPIAPPLGLLTHHLEMTPDDWRGFTSVCAMLKTEGAVKFLDPAALF